MDWLKELPRILAKRASYRRMFFNANGDLHRDAEVVLKDLRRFCRRNSTLVYDAAGRVDPIAMANANGRREVYDRIIKHLHLSDEVETRLQEVDENG